MFRTFAKRRMRTVFICWDLAAGSKKGEILEKSDPFLQKTG